MGSRGTYKKIFNDKALLKEMLSLRAGVDSESWSVIDLAEKYGCNHSSIIAQCKKANIKPIKKLKNFKKPVVDIYAGLNYKNKKMKKYKDEFGETINMGVSYKTYVKRANERKRISR